jgi:diguanylate cyclase (GGDEF)-like protein/PAS domain S-box-containing protein
MIKGTGYPYVSEPFVGRASQVPMVMIGVPRWDENGEFAGMVGGTMSLRSGGLFSRLASKQIGDDSYITMFTASGTILYHPDRKLVMSNVLDLSDNSKLDLAMSGWQGDVVGELINGKAGLQSYGQVWPADWVIGRFMTLEQAQLPLAGFIKRLWWVWGIMALWMLPLLWWVLGSMLQTLRHLEIQIGDVGRGHRERIELTSGVFEFQEIAETFNQVEAERKVLLGSLKEREAFFNAILDSTPQGMFVANFDGEITYMNPPLITLLGSAGTLDTSQWFERIHPDDRVGAADMWRHCLATHSDFLRQLRFICPNHETLWLEVHARVVMLSKGGHSLGLVGMMKDITQRREEEALQRWEAEHDPLTGLLNRRGFERRLGEAFAEYQKTSTPSALLLFDLDHFKPINDEGGHALGDEMLRRIAQVVAWEVRRSDHVARQGGDEFGVLLPSCTLPQAQTIAESLRTAVNEITVTHQGKEYGVTLSLGVTSFIETDQTVDAALSRADAASYEAKAHGRNAVVVNVPDEGGMRALFD